MFANGYFGVDIVALLAEGVGRNALPESLQSAEAVVALLAEGVGRNWFSSCV